MESPVLTLRQHQKLEALLDTEQERLVRLRRSRTRSHDLEGANRVITELYDLMALKRLILSLPHQRSHWPGPEKPLAPEYTWLVEAG